MKKFILFLFLGLFFLSSNLNAQTPSTNKHFGIARLDSLKRVEKALKLEIDSCQAKVLKNENDGDIANCLDFFQFNLERTQRQIQYIKQIKGKQTKKN